MQCRLVLGATARDPLARATRSLIIIALDQLEDEACPQPLPMAADHGGAPGVLRLRDGAGAC